jgi:hypothetical protein
MAIGVVILGAAVATVVAKRMGPAPAPHTGQTP